MSNSLPGTDLFYLPEDDLAPERFELILPPWRAWDEISHEYVFFDALPTWGRIVTMRERMNFSVFPSHGNEGASAKKKLKSMVYSGEVVKIRKDYRPEGVFWIDDAGALQCAYPSDFDSNGANNVIRAYNKAVRRRDYSRSGGKPRPTVLPNWRVVRVKDDDQPAAPGPRTYRERLPEEITLVLGIFFDGTGNNAVNVRNMLAACSGEHFHIGSADVGPILTATAREKMGVSGIGAVSYTSYYSNVHWLSTLYKQMTSPVMDHVQRAVYIEGIGTRTGEPDRSIGIGLGISDTGVVAKTDRAVEELVQAIEQAIVTIRETYHHRPFSIVSLKFDIFGFSRGSAAARHFANRIQMQDPALVNAVRAGMAHIDYTGSPAGKTRFIGIFDTVAAIGTPVNGLNPHSADTGSVMLQLRPGVADRVFHLTAEHECRFNFALNSLSPAWSEFSLPGVHADIGGGYLPLVREDLFLSRPQGETVPLQRPDEHTSAWRNVRHERVDLHYASSMAPLLRNQEVVIETWSDDRMPQDRYGNMQKRSFAALAVRNRLVKNDWSKVALRVMIDAAEEAGVIFDPIRETNKELTLPAELVPLCNKALMQARAARKKSYYEPFSKHEMAIIAPYIHCSAHWNAVQLNDRGLITGGALPSETLSFPHRPDLRWQRTVYNMDGKKQ